MLRRLRASGRIILSYALLGLGASIAVAWGLVFTVDLATGTAWGSSGSDTKVLPYSEDYLREQSRSASRSYRSSLGSSRRALLYDPKTTLLDGLNKNRILILNHILDDEITHHPSNHFMPESVDEYIESKSAPPKWKLEFNTAIPRSTAWGRLYSFTPEAFGTEKLFWLEDARGFPFLCVWSSWTDEPAGLIGAGGIQLPATRNSLGLRVQALPYRPIWLGLAANTAFYGLLFYLVVRTWKGLRGWRRFNRGLCPACAYDLRYDYSRGCSECGRGVKRVTV